MEQGVYFEGFGGMGRTHLKVPSAGGGASCGLGCGTIALGMPSPALRAAAISVLVLLVPQNPEQGEFSAVVRRVLLGCFSSRPHVSI